MVNDLCDCVLSEVVLHADNTTINKELALKLQSKVGNLKKIPKLSSKLDRF